MSMQFFKIQLKKTFQLVVGEEEQKKLKELVAKVAIFFRLKNAIFARQQGEAFEHSRSGLIGTFLA